MSLRMGVRLVLVATATVSAAMAQDVRTVVIGSFEPNLSEEALAARAPDRSPGITHEYHRLHAPGDGRGVSVFVDLAGEEGARIHKLRKYAGAGLIAYPVDPIDDCALDIANRKDEVAVALASAEVAEQAAGEARAAADAATHALAEALADYDAAAQALADAEAAAQAAQAKVLAAHEAAHVAQQRAGVALRAAQSNPNPQTLQALSDALARSVQALRAEALALRAQADTNSRLIIVRQEFGQVKAQRDTLQAAAVRAVDEADNEDKNAATARAAAGKLVNAEIAAATAEAAEEAQALAEDLAAQADFAAQAKASYGGNPGIGAPQYDRLAEVAVAASIAAGLALADAKQALAVAAQAQQLPPFPTAASAADAANLPQYQVLNALLDVADAQTVDAMVLSMGVVGGGASHTANNDALSALQDLCADGSCAPGAVEDLVAQAEGLTATQLQTAHQSGGRRFQTLSNASRCIKDADRNLLNVIR